MELKMEVYSPSLELLGVLEQYRSLIYEDKAFSTGSFSLEALLTDEPLSLLVPENILWLAEDTAGIIEYIQEQAGKDGPYMTVKGRLLTGILDRRILWGLYDLYGTAPAIMRYLVEDCAVNPTRGDDPEARKLPGLVLLDAPAGGEAVRIQKTGGTLLEALEEIGEAYGVAFGVRFNPEVPRMEFWTRRGVNRSVNQTANEPVFYSTELDDVLSSEYSYDSTGYRNITLVAGEGEGNERVYVTVGNKVESAPEPPVPPEPVYPEPTPPEPVKYTITLSVDPQGGGIAAGGGTAEAGSSVTVTAAPSNGYTFTGWQENGAIVSTNSTYTFTVTGDRALAAVFEAESVSRLPEGYTEVEYIHSDSSSYIQTDVSMNLKTGRLVMDIEAGDRLTGSEYIFSAALSSSSYYLYLYRKSSTALVSRFGSYSAVTRTLDIANKRLVVDLDFSNKSLTIGDTKYTTTQESATMTTKIKLFNSTSIKAKLYSAQIYTSGGIQADFVPCIAPTGAVGLYDLTTDTFYGNAGTGTFTAGPAV